MSDLTESAPSSDPARGLFNSLSGPLLLAFVLICLFREALFREGVIALGDVPDQFLPWRRFVEKSLSEGTIPLWNPFTFCGAPFLANMQSAVLHPIDRFFDLAFPPHTSLMWSLVIQMWMGGAFLFILARRLGAGWGAAAVSAIGYALGGFHAIHLLGGNLLTVTSSIYLPGHLLIIHLLAERCRNGEKAGGILFGGIALASLQVVSGHGQMLFYNAVFATLFLIGKIWEIERGRLRLTINAIAAAVVAFLITSPQLLSTYEYSNYSSRSGILPFEAATEFSFGWEILPSLFLPEYLGTRADAFTHIGSDTYWGDWKNWSAIYIGIFPALGFAYFFAKERKIMGSKRALIPWLGLMVAALLLSLGPHTPIYYFVHHYLPFFGKLGAPSKFLPGLIVPIALLGATGIGSWMRNEMIKTGQTAWSKGVPLLVSGAVVLFLTAAFQRFYADWGPISLTVRELFRSFAIVLLGVGGFSAAVGIKDPTQDETSSTTGGSYRIPRTSPVIFLIGVSMIDMGWYASKYIVLSPVESLPKFPVAWVGTDLEDGYRLHATPEIPFQNACIPAGLPITGGYDPFQVGSYASSFEDELGIDSGKVLDAWAPPLEWAPRLGASLVMTTQTLRDSKFVPIKREGQLQLYRIRDPAPFVEFTPAEQGKGDEAVLDQVRIEYSWEGQTLHLRGQAPSAGNVLIRQVYVPGWVAINPQGEAREVLQADPFWQTVSVGRGEFDLALTYQPRGWGYGIFLSSLGFFLWILIGTWYCVGPRQGSRTTG